MTQLIRTHKQDVEAILTQYLGPKPAKEATAKVGEVLRKLHAQTQAEMIESFEAAISKVVPKKTAKKTKPKARTPTEPKVKAAPKKAAPKKTGTKKVAVKVAQDQSQTKSMYWALVRHYKGDASSEDKALIKAQPELAKEQRDGAKKRAEAMLAKAPKEKAPKAAKRPVKKASTTKRPAKKASANGAITPAPASAAAVEALNL